MANRSKKIKKTDSESKMGDNQSYCRRCTRVRLNIHFHKCTDKDVDANGLWSICKDCINEMYAIFLESEKSHQKVTLQMCRLLNLEYNELALESALKQAETKGSSTVFGYYRAKLLIQLRTNVKDTNIDYSYKDNPVINTGMDIPDVTEVSPDVISFWGKGYDTEEYQWLEENLDSWKMSHRCDTKGEETLLKEIVFKQWEIEKARSNESSTASLVKELQDLMKTASVDPSKANSLSQSKNDTFSSFIKMIEENEPAEVFGEERDAFRDFGNIGRYWQRYVVRSIKNFMTGSRDFNIEDETEADIENFDEMEKALPEIPVIDDNDIKKLTEVSDGN